MILAFSFKDILAVPFGYVIEGLHYITGNIGIAMILFALTVSLLMHPLNIKRAVSAYKKARLQPNIPAIRKMFPKDLEAQNTLMERMYKKEKVSLSFGFFASAISMFVLIMLFAAVSHPITYSLHVDKETTKGVIELLKGLEPAAFASGYDEVVAASLLPKYAAEVKSAFPAINDFALQGLNFEFLGLNLARTPSLNFDSWNGASWENIGLLLIPCTAVLCSLLPAIIAFCKRFAYNAKHPNAPKKAGKTNWLNVIMMLLFFILCFQVPASLCMYWAAKSLFGFILSFHVKAKVAKVPENSVNLTELVMEYKKQKREEAKSAS